MSRPKQVGEQARAITDRVSLSDVASDANVSRSTASLVMRGSDLVAEQTRKRVLHSVKKLGYIYNRGAASLRTNRSQTVGLIVTDLSNPFFAELTLGTEQQLNRSGYVSLLGNTSESLEKQDQLLTAMFERGVDGFLLCPSETTAEETLDQLRAWGLPIVLVARHLPDQTVDYVGANNAVGAELGTRHLIRKGHTRIAFIGGPERSSARRERMEGFAAAHERHALPVDEGLLITSPVTRRGGLEAVKKLVGLPNPPTAAVCYNDVVALGVMLGLQSEGYKPGDDFSVVGFDDIADAALSQPALTTLSVPPQEIGRQAAQLLLARIANPRQPARQVVLTPELIVRDS